MTTIYLGLGSNVDPQRNLRFGLDELRRRFGELVISPTYQSAAVGFDGDDFLNLVVSTESDADPETLRDELEDIHRLAGRQRNEERFSSRTLDIDLLLAGDLVTDGPPIRLPRTDVLEYAYVLRPLADIAPDVRHPETGRTFLEHWQGFDQDSQPLTEVALDPD
ncbi:MAG: 2-amino-4-hydroxy-6-hydroxymethyldihydropteridine diphosphokinase [Woeseiaceae bacterium]|nr:2-amino-4-hydroxy-6-hydroxymethyldihydropteridine diphosphokinase [Woeseiaceae bacterium]